MIFTGWAFLLACSASPIVLVIVLVLGFGKVCDFVIKAVIDRANRLVPLACKEVEDENDDEVEDDWGSRGRELRPTIAGIICIKAIDQSGQHCYNTREHWIVAVESR